jgi:hypothetical protein
MTPSLNRFEEVRADAVAARAAALELRKVEDGYRRALALTDDLLGQLERRNLAGKHELDEIVRRNLARAMNELPPDARARYPDAGTVQEALDGVFLVQESLLLVLQRMLHWDRLVA